MKIAIIAAMGKELDLLLHLIDNHATVTINDSVYHTGTIGGREVVAVRSGIGKVNAAVATLTLIENFHPSLVINTGVAGGTGPAKILDVVIPDRIAYHDVWCGPGTEWGQAADAPLYFECPLDADTVASLGARRGLLASGDIFVSRPDEVRHILDLYPDAVAVDMESAAIAQVCRLKNVPFVCVRVISDTPGAADNIAQYENFWDDAPRHTFATLQALIDRL
ncbi:MAG: 5'-methylthioadenosine/adenosylhomocysteine nucleosidase [Bacteroidales bacterium]|nr:5'-methylthioadenosine/adenosylhomocysteine nucleosidase [Bacteroidales bacterium]